MSARKQRAVVVSHFDKDHPENAVEVVEKPIPKPRPGEALVRLLLRPINPSDLFSIGGIYGGFQPKLPATPGLEGMGKIEDLGPGPTPEGLPQRLRVGQRVVGVPWPAAEGEGTYQQYVAVPLEHLVPVADNLSDENAAQFLVNPVTVMGFLEDLKVPKGKYLLQNAANSVLGKELISAAKHRGVKTINVVRRKEVIDELKALGADEVINSSEEDVVSRVKEITGGEGAWAALNPIGGPASRVYPSSVRNGGTVYIYSMMGDDVHVPMYDEVFRLVTVRGWWLNAWLESLDKQKREEALQETMHLMAEGIIKPPPTSAKFPLDQIKEAIKTAKEKSGKGGKVMLEG